MASDDVDRFSELLCSRLCHDLISPIGAINNGIELVSEGDTSMLKDALSLIGLSARQANARLAYFRLAFGAWGSDAAMGFGSIRSIAEEHFSEKKCPVVWSAPMPPDTCVVDKQVGKLILNLLLVAAECAQRDGHLEVALDLDPAARRISVTVRAERCKLREDVRSGFESSVAADGLTVRNVIAHHCQRLSRSLGLNLTVVNQGGNSLEFCVA